MISINSWGPTDDKISHNSMYFFGRNDKYSYPFYGRDGWLQSWHGSCDFCKEDGGNNFKNAVYRRNNNPYEPVYSARRHHDSNLLCMNVVKIPDFGVINQNTIGKEREYHQYDGHVSQLIVYNCDKTHEEILVIEDILKFESGFEYPLNSGDIYLENMPLRDETQLWVLQMCKHYLQKLEFVNLCIGHSKSNWNAFA